MLFTIRNQNLKLLINDIEASTEANGESVNLQSVFLVTYKNIANPADSSQLNTYQTVIATGLIGSSASTKHFVLHNFATMSWTPDTASIGVFAANEEAEQCHSALSPASGLGNLENDSNLGENGKYIQVYSQNLECTTRFETLCPVHQEGSRATSSGMLALKGFKDSAEWDFYVSYECDPQFEITPGVEVISSVCRYDPDYYDSRWTAEAPTCTNGETVKTFDIKIVVDQIGDSPAAAASQERGDGAEILVQSGLSELIEYIGIDDSQVSDINIRPFSPDEEWKNEQRAEVDPTDSVIVEFTIELPLAVKDKVTEDDIKENIKNVVSELDIIGELDINEENIQVIEKTPQCLVDCLGCRDKKKCGDKPPPIPYDACCGGCPEDNPARGKPYSTLVKSCCVDGWNGEIYDHDTHVCCNGKVMSKEDYNVSFFMRSQCRE
ncbi:Oidioi.mRNA.OKI2018_I69.chr1.g2152.t1.cds [Oikopleura dioica]|uniref:Oidioi.mRNA.OKI2018_I69.chr1.g2152.t1.cds n=1 Tax=Oikopleura dioica TaxID=34765 RepID=A0ABN7SVI5_OIKDI|nr:Oidioi.mRNA.OKI2018_I69.chr1.g2152.t1.cds [Oikopleura dioica]